MGDHGTGITNRPNLPRMFATFHGFTLKFFHDVTPPTVTYRCISSDRAGRSTLLFPHSFGMSWCIYYVLRPINVNASLVSTHESIWRRHNFSTILSEFIWYHYEKDAFHTYQAYKYKLRFSFLKNNVKFGKMIKSPSFKVCHITCYTFSPSFWQFVNTTPFC